MYACIQVLSPRPNDACTEFMRVRNESKLFGCCSMPCPHDHSCHNVQQQPFSHTSLADADCDKSHVALQDQVEVERPCFRHVQSHIGRCRLVVQTGQQLSTAFFCTTGHVVRCFCDSNGAKLYDSRHQGHYNIVRKLASWSGQSTRNISWDPGFPEAVGHSTFLCSGDFPHAMLVYRSHLAKFV